MALGSPIALVGIIIMAINTGKEGTPTSPTSPVSAFKTDAGTETVSRMGINIRSYVRISVRKGTELCADQSTVETVRSRRHLGLFQFSRPSFCAVKELVEVV